MTDDVTEFPVRRRLGVPDDQGQAVTDAAPRGRRGWTIAEQAARQGLVPETPPPPRSTGHRPLTMSPAQAVPPVPVEPARPADPAQAADRTPPAN
ncbi:hypothetical protein ACFV4P_35465 [Kitasatospora sp. NPDC059795]|uniref:hypothetical protein n=1 Tax=Kitasatospora sp. NPDC059795 TaxID=3346949 RepID=UPI00365A7F75